MLFRSAVFTYGFPVAQILGTEPKFTEGAISALSGVRGDSTYMQISTPIQPGNSGGPLVNDRGEVVGIIAATAAVEAFFKASGSFPQNINWAVKSEFAASMFDQPAARQQTSDRAHAIERTRKAICKIEAEASGS